MNRTVKCGRCTAALHQSFLVAIIEVGLCTGVAVKKSFTVYYSTDTDSL